MMSSDKCSEINTKMKVIKRLAIIAIVILLMIPGVAYVVHVGHLHYVSVDVCEYIIDHDNDVFNSYQVYKVDGGSELKLNISGEYYSNAYAIYILRGTTDEDVDMALDQYLWIYNVNGKEYDYYDFMTLSRTDTDGNLDCHNPLPDKLF